MTSRDLVWLLLRRWYLVLLGAGISGAALAWTWGQPGIYTTRFDVVLLTPPYRSIANSMEDHHDSLTPLAAVVVSDYNGVDEPVLTASSNTTLYGLGVREGSQVRLPNMGSQWKPLFVQPNIDVQVVASTSAEVELRAAEIVDELVGLLEDRQSDLRVEPRNHVKAITSPSDPVTTYVGGSRGRSGLAIALLGASLTVLVIFWMERLRLVFYRRRAAPLKRNQRIAGAGGSRF